MNTLLNVNADLDPTSDAHEVISPAECESVLRTAAEMAGQAPAIRSIIAELASIASGLAEAGDAAHDYGIHEEAAECSFVMAAAALCVAERTLPEVGMDAEESVLFPVEEASPRRRRAAGSRPRTTRRRNENSEDGPGQMALPLAGEMRPRSSVASFADRLERVRGSLAREELEADKAPRTAVSSFAERLKKVRERLAHDDFRTGTDLGRIGLGLMAKPPHFSMIRDFHLADWFTIANAFCGMGAVLAVMAFLTHARSDGLYLGAVLIPLAAVFDVLDGRIARWRQSQSALGRELDSLADAISFGVAPAAMAFAAGLNGLWDCLALVYFVGCGVSRLARYNITAEALSADASGKVKYFEGTPIPSSVLLVFVLAFAAWKGRIGDSVWFGYWQLGPWHLHPLVLMYLLSGSLMISKTIHIPKL